MNARCLTSMLFAMLILPSSGLAVAEETQRAKSERTAVLASALGTAVPLAVGIGAVISSDEESGGYEAGSLLILSGYLIGPSLGHFYAERPGAAFAGMGLRVIPFLGLGAAVAAAWDQPSKAADALAVGSLALGAGITVWDIARTAKSVRAYNKQLTHPQVSLGAIPVGREIAPAIVVSVRM